MHMGIGIVYYWCTLYNNNNIYLLNHTYNNS